MPKNIKNLILLFIGLIFLAGIITLIYINKNDNGDNPNPISYSASILTTVENNFDFNTISMKDSKVSHIFELKNDGSESVIIKKVYTSCMCTTANIIDSSGKKYGEFGMPGHGHNASLDAEIRVAPGDVVKVEAIFDPAAHGPSGVGLAQRSIYLETNSQQSPKIELTFQAIVNN